MTRSEVYQLIDGERDYQDHLGPDRTDGRSHTVGEYLTMLRHYTTTADAAWAEWPGDWEALDVIRKIAAIAVRCMEQHGAPARVPDIWAHCESD